MDVKIRFLYMYVCIWMMTNDDELGGKQGRGEEGGKETSLCYMYFYADLSLSLSVERLKKS